VNALSQIALVVAIVTPALALVVTVGILTYPRESFKRRRK